MDTFAYRLECLKLAANVARECGPQAVVRAARLFAEYMEGKPESVVQPKKAKRPPNRWPLKMVMSPL